MEKLDNLSFEEAYERLERTVQRLEQGGLALEETIALFEEGMRLARICGDRLDKAELKITRLQSAFGEVLRDEEDPRTGRGP